MIGPECGSKAKKKSTSSRNSHTRYNGSNRQGELSYHSLQSEYTALHFRRYFALPYALAANANLCSLRQQQIEKVNIARQIGEKKERERRTVYQWNEEHISKRYEENEVSRWSECAGDQEEPLQDTAAQDA